ncbi:MAG: CinA family nicotinamide mononucleotide deamidase-related protein [Bacteroidales bacterium]|nr:CinA family nicotinamide mononucleotide deamidase-related protein [Bacteroidales bacterium]
MKCEIIVIGDELLIGQVTDTNSGYIARRLNPVGVDIMRVTAIRDLEDEIISAVEEAMSRADAVIVTGGLGPTNDDITKTTLCKIFGGKMIFSQSTQDNNDALFARMGKEMNSLTRSQAMVPDCCKVLPNVVGTAPGMIFKREGKMLISLPGVPYEMQKLIEDSILPLFERCATTDKIFHSTRIVEGFTESNLALYLADYEASLPSTIKLAYLPKPRLIRLRLTARGNDSEALYCDMYQATLKLDELLKDNIISYEDLTLQEILLRLLQERNLTISTAESCTGGGVASKLTSVSGASANFMGSVVAYDNSIKINTIGVSEEVIKEYGVVSTQVVEQMAKGVAEKMKTDCAIATSGIAGPSGGSKQKPVGTIAIGLYCCGETRSCLVTIPATSRDRNVERFVDLALFNMIKFIKG